LRSVFDFFENCNSAIIIWRPHPLLGQTISTMHPELLDEWTNLVTYFKTKNFGIFDDTADMYQATSVSNGYYGDLISSVQTIYQSSGKPVLIQDINYQTYSDYDSSNINLSSTLYLESDQQIRIADFIKRLDDISSKNSIRLEKFHNKYTNADGTAGKKILDYVLSNIK
jgi:guanylate kinase